MEKLYHYTIHKQKITRIVNYIVRFSISIFLVSDGESMYEVVAEQIGLLDGYS